MAAADPGDAGGFQVQSVADQVYEVLRERIASGEIERGSRMHQEDLAKEFGVSRTPVREALRRLAAEGLVDLFANRGARVATATDEQLRSSYETRLVVEPGAARIAAERGAARADRADAGGDRRRGARRPLARQALQGQPRLPPRPGQGDRQPAAGPVHGARLDRAHRRDAVRGSPRPGRPERRPRSRTARSPTRSSPARSSAPRSSPAATSSGRWSCSSSTDGAVALSRAGCVRSAICRVFSSE